MHPWNWSLYWNRVPNENERDTDLDRINSGKFISLESGRVVQSFSGPLQSIPRRTEKNSSDRSDLSIWISGKCNSGHAPLDDLLHPSSWSRNHSARVRSQAGICFPRNCRNNPLFFRIESTTDHSIDPDRFSCNPVDLRAFLSGLDSYRYETSHGLSVLTLDLSLWWHSCREPGSGSTFYQRRRPRLSANPGTSSWNRFSSRARESSPLRSGRVLIPREQQFPVGFTGNSIIKSILPYKSPDFSLFIFQKIMTDVLTSSAEF